MKRLLNLIFLLPLLWNLSPEIYAQSTRPVVVKGQVLDGLDQSPLSYASVGIFDLNDELKSGGITNETGYFEI